MRGARPRGGDGCALPRVTEAACGRRRKVLRQSLKSLGVDTGALLEQAGITPTARAEEIDVAGFVVKGLREAGHLVEHAETGPDGLFKAAGQEFDAIILDRMLPGGVDGLRLLEVLRGQDNQTPVLFLSAIARADARVPGLPYRMLDLGGAIAIAAMLVMAVVAAIAHTRQLYLEETI